MDSELYKNIQLQFLAKQKAIHVQSFNPSLNKGAHAASFSLNKMLYMTCRASISPGAQHQGVNDSSKRLFLSFSYNL